MLYLCLDFDSFVFRLWSLCEEIMSNITQRRDTLCVSRSDQRSSNVYSCNHDIHFPRRHDRGEIRFAHLALISGRQISIRASTMSIFLVAMTKRADDKLSCLSSALCSEVSLFLPLFRQDVFLSSPVPAEGFLSLPCPDKRFFYHCPCPGKRFPFTSYSRPVTGSVHAA